MTLGPSRAATQALLNATQPFPANGTVLATSDGETLPATLIYPGNSINVAQAPFFAKGDAKLLNTGLVSGHDDTDAFAAAAEKALAENVPLVLGGGQNYKISAEIPVGEIYIYGNGCNLLAAQSMRSLMFFSGSTHSFDVNFQGNGFALQSVLQTQVSRYYRCLFRGGVTDGLHLASSFGPFTANNDNTTLRDCQLFSNGIAFCSAGMGAPSGVRRQVIPGTVAMSGNTITGAGTTWLSDADPAKRLTNWRTGDIIFVEGGVIGFQIQSVDSDTSITTQTWASGTIGAGANYRIGIGDGYHEDEFNDNNINLLDGVSSKFNGGCGYAISGLYGPNCPKIEADLNGGYPVVIGQAGAGAPACTVIGHLYTEANGALDAAILAAHANGIFVGGIDTDAATEAALYNVSLAYGSVQQSLIDQGALIKPIGGPVDTIPGSITYAPSADPGSTPGQNQVVFWLDVPGNQVVMRVHLPAGGGYKTINLPWF